MEAYIRSLVTSLSLDEDVYVDYVKGILEDEDLGSFEDRVESMVSILSSAMDPENEHVLKDVSLLVKEIQDVLDHERKQTNEKEEKKIFEKQMEDLKIREQEKQIAEKAKEKEKQAILNKTSTLSREDMLQREKIIQAYGFSALSELDEDGNVIQVKKDSSNDLFESTIGGNTNKQRVLEAQQAMRDKMKKEHLKKITKEKELLEKERLKKEKQKKKTQKKEKQRGAG